MTRALPSIPEISEAAADLRTRALYDDIKRVTGVPVVNLVYRHLATLPGALPWAWRVLRDGYATGEVAARAAALRAKLGAGLPPLSGASFRLLGLDKRAIEDIGAVIETYNAGNALNIVALTALRLVVEGRARRRAGAEIVEAATPPLATRRRRPLQSLPALAALSPSVLEQVLWLNRLGETRAPREIASLYRHLAHWPAYLALIGGLLLPLDAAGELARLREAVRREAERLAAPLAARLARAAAAPAPSPLLPVLTRFTGAVIPKMLAVGTLLAASLPRSLAPRAPRLKRPADAPHAHRKPRLRAARRTQRRGPLRRGQPH
ncbi:MAG TPA: hypothetical protein VMU06_18905 [Stellaceae bacterium]|nr:hypothetical protein [Stellaceae bacterium]